MSASERPLRVLMTTDTVGGVWTYSLELIRALADCDVAVWLAAMGDVSGDQRQAAAAVPNLVLLQGDFALEWMDDPWSDVDAASRWLLELASLIDPDVVHVNGYAHAALPFDRPVLSVAHSCVCSWWQACIGGEAPPRFDRYRQRVAGGLRAADQVVAPTAAILEAVLRAHGTRRPGRVIENGVDTERTRTPAVDPGEAKEPMVLSAGRLWDPAKNLAALDRAASSLPWPVRVAGPVEEPGSKRRCPAFGAVELLGSLAPAELRALMRRTPIYALPARYEPFGLSALEAALSGCALVLGDIPTLRELWDGAAEFVAPDDPGALAAALTALIHQPARRRERARLARERARRFTSDRMARAYRELYDEMIASRALAAAGAGRRGATA